METIGRGCGINHRFWAKGRGSRLRDGNEAEINNLTGELKAKGRGSRLRDGNSQFSALTDCDRLRLKAGVPVCGMETVGIGDFRPAKRGPAKGRGSRLRDGNYDSQAIPTKPGPG